MKRFIVHFSFKLRKKFLVFLSGYAKLFVRVLLALGPKIKEEGINRREVENTNNRVSH